MKIVTTTILFAALLTASTALASTVVVTNTSSSQTGGVTSGKNGEAVVTGDSSASSAVYTNINSNNEGSTVDIKIETEQDGTKQEEAKHYTVPKGESVRIEVATSSGSASAIKATTSVTVGDQASTTSEASTMLQIEPSGASASGSIWDSFFGWLPRFWGMLNIF